MQSFRVTGPIQDRSGVVQYRSVQLTEPIFRLLLKVAVIGTRRMRESIFGHPMLMAARRNAIF